MSITFFSRWDKWLGICGLFGVLGILVYLYVPSLGSYPYRDWDESIYAQVARESMTHPLAFTWLGYGVVGESAHFWFEKPPLVIWLVQVSYSIFGVGEFSARLVTFIFGLATVVLAYVWARHITKSVWAGLLASCSLLACFHFLLNIGISNLDIPVGFFMALALYGYSRAVENKEFWYLFWVSLALGTLTKSVVGLVPLGVVGVHQIFTGRGRTILNSFFPNSIHTSSSVISDAILKPGSRLPDSEYEINSGRDDSMLYKGLWKDKSFRYGFGLFLVIVIPWHLVETIKFGSVFWQSYFGYHVLDRFIHPIENNGNVWWYYFTIFKQVPFGLFAIAGLVFGLYKGLKKRADYLLLCLSVISIFVLFSVAQTKGSGYMVVVYPYLAVLGGCAIYEVVSKLKKRRLLYMVIASCIGICVASGLAYNNYRIVKMSGQVYADIYTVGRWIQGKGWSGDIYYVSLKAKEGIISASPLLVYTAQSHVSEVSSCACEVLESPIFRTPTHFVYVRGKILYVEAVRFIP